MRRASSWHKEGTTFHCVFSSAFPGAEVMSSISDSDYFLLAEAESGLLLLRGKLTPRRGRECVL
jgi:hypothetical protein